MCLASTGIESWTLLCSQGELLVFAADAATWPDACTPAMIAKTFAGEMELCGGHCRRR